MRGLRLSKVKTKKQKYIKKEVSVSSFIPYLCHWNSNTILTQNYEFVKIIRIKGYSFETADDEDLDIKKNIRNSLFKGMALGTYALWFHTVRTTQSAFPDGDMPNFFAEYTNQEWRSRHDGNHSFKNIHYITVIRKKDNATTAMIESITKKFKYKADKASWEQDMIDEYEELDEIANRVLNSFSNYGAKMIGVVETENGAFSEMLEFLGSIVNCGQRQPMQVPSMEIRNYLPTHRLYFGKKAIEVKGVLGRRFAGIVSLKEYRPGTNAGMLDSFLQLPYEFIIAQSFSFTNRMSAISSMRLQQNRLIQSEDVAKSQTIEISQALDAAMSGEFGFGHHHLTILCLADTLKELESNLSLAVVEFSNIGVTAVREKINMEAAYWAQLPCNFDYIVRKATVNTLNLASYASFHNYPTGKHKGNHWGNAVTVFNTVSGTPFFFSFHTRDVGHTTIIGPTGSGKTVLMNFLCCQAQKFDGRMFFFDKDRGAEIFIRAVEGRYSILDRAFSSGFNPFHLEDSPENRSFLIEFIKTLVMSEEGSPALTPEDTARLKEAVDGNYKLDKKDRRLANVVAFLGMATPGSLASRMEMWHSEGSHARLFDNEADIVDFTAAKNFGFEMGHILKDPPSLNAVLLYLFHRINMSLDGTRTAIILDEAWALIDNPVFAPKIKDWLKVLRKLNAFVVFATQSVEDAAKSSISDTLIQQTGTQIFLPNLKATDMYQTAFMLSNREYQLIKTTDPASRYFLVKQGQDSVVARIDLSGMDLVIKTLSGTAETVIIADEVRAECGDKPEVWLPIFWQRVS